MFTTVIWDWNGTLLNDVEANLSIVNTLLEKRGMPPIDIEAYRRYFRMPIVDFYRDIGFTFQDETFGAVAEEYNRMYRAAFASMALSDGIREMLDYLDSRGIAQYIVSASHQRDLLHQVREKGIDSYFRKIVGNDDYAVASKLEKGLGLHRELGKGHTIAFIGDMYHDYEVAKAMGATCILYDSGHQKIADSPDYIRIKEIGEIRRHV